MQLDFLVVFCLLPVACLSCPNIIRRAEWNADPPLKGNVQCMKERSQNILIHHTYVPKICKTMNVCKSNMKSMQHYHQTSRAWPDIGYNFCIGGDGNIYEGTGWGVVAYPARGFESNSTNICFIGDYIRDMPSEQMLQAAINLIECGIEKGYIEEHVRVLGIREVIPTESPGAKLQSYISYTRFGYPRSYNNEIN